MAILARHYQLISAAAVLIASLVIGINSLPRERAGEVTPITPSDWAELVDPIFEEFPARPLLGGVESPALTRHLESKGISWAAFRAGARLALDERNRAPAAIASQRLLDWDPRSGETRPSNDDLEHLPLETIERFELIEDLLARVIRDHRSRR